MVLHKRAERQPNAIGKMVPMAPFDLVGWKKGDLKKKMHIGALSWADQGFGAPKVAYVFYLLKHLFWWLAWRWFCGFGSSVSDDWPDLLTSDSMKRLVVWNLLFELLNFGCASGPLTVRRGGVHSAIVT